MKFSQRKGYSSLPKPLPKEGMTEELRNSLWNVLHTIIWTSKYFTTFGGDTTGIGAFSKTLWFHYFKKPVDNLPPQPDDKLSALREYFFACKWYEVFDFLEFVLEYPFEPPVNRDAIPIAINAILERELSPYRCINGTFTEITDKQESLMLEQAMTSDDFPSVTSHLNRALELLSDRKKPDFRNSIKESISAVESMAQIITKNPKATLGDALKIIQKAGKLHGALKEGFSNLYGYTSDEGGIRHAMLEEPNLAIEDAKFFLLACTSFVNYLKSKMN
jgi:AbiJ N-terminal domain 4